MTAAKSSRPQSVTACESVGATGAASAEVAQIQRLGKAIRELRQAQSLTLVQLAAMTGLSHPFLSQVERGKARPGMKSLFDIAQALGTTQDRIMAGAAEISGQPQPAVTLLRANEGLAFGPDGDSLARPVSGGVARQLIAELGSFYPTEFSDIGESAGDFWYAHPGNEMCYVVYGIISIDLAVSGTDAEPVVHTLTAGDSLRYSGSIPHRWYANGRGPNRSLMIHSGAHDSAPSAEQD